jgi:hypothetical protein
VPGAGDAAAGRFLKADGTWAVPSASVAIGSSLTSSTAGSVLFADAAGKLAQNNAKLFWDDADARLGIGTTLPGYLLDIAGAGAGTLATARLQNTIAAANNSGAQLLFGANRSAFGMTNVAGVSGLITDTASFNYKGALAFFTADSAAPVERMRIDDKGSVGIGTSSPTAGLHVNAPASTALTGTVSAAIGSPTVNGSGTSFDTELAVGDAIRIDNSIYTVGVIGSATSLTLTSNMTESVGGFTVYRNGRLLSVGNASGATKVVVDKSGNVGIGTTRPPRRRSTSRAACARSSPRATRCCASSPATATPPSCWTFAATTR